jgi:hypothetical protein
VFHKGISSFVKMHLLRFNVDNGETLLSSLGRLQVDISFLLGCNLPFILLPTTIYELDPLPDYFIDHLYIKDLLLFRVSLQEHPWGVNIVVYIKENYNA